jgi:hypothetical protein
MPPVADRHSGVLMAAGGIVVAAGAASITVAALEPSAKPHSIFANIWTDMGLALVLTGLLITAVGLHLHFRRQPDSPSPPPGRTGYRVRESAKVFSRNSRIRNQDQAFDVSGNAELHDRDADIR